MVGTSNCSRLPAALSVLLYLYYVTVLAFLYPGFAAHGFESHSWSFVVEKLDKQHLQLFLECTGVCLNIVRILQIEKRRCSYDHYRKSCLDFNSISSQKVLILASVIMYTFIKTTLACDPTIPASKTTATKKPSPKTTVPQKAATQPPQKTANPDGTWYFWNIDHIDDSHNYENVFLHVHLLLSPIPIGWLCPTNPYIHTFIQSLRIFI